MACMHENWKKHNPPQLMLLKQLDGQFAQPWRSAQSTLSRERQLTVYVVLSLCKHCDRSLKGNKWVTRHLERFLFDSYPKSWGMPLLFLSVCWTGAVVIAFFLGLVGVVTLLGWCRQGWGWVCVSPSLDTWGRWPYGCSTPLLVWAPLPRHIWPELQVKPATQTENWHYKEASSSFLCFS